MIIILYYKDDTNNKYIKEYQYKGNGSNHSIIQTKDNEICFSDLDKKYKYSIVFFDLNKKKIIKRIKMSHFSYSFNIISKNKNLLMSTGEDKISIININTYKFIRTIFIPKSGYINGVCILNDIQIITGDYNKNIIQWKIEEDNLILKSKKENLHDGGINTLLKIDDEHILSGDNLGYIKIWYYSKEN